MTTMDDKWFANIDSAGLSSLQKIGDDINKVVQETVMTVARARLRIGSLLIDARTLFKGDREFGRWRAEVLPDIAPRTANTYMNMAKHFKNAPELLEAVGWTAAREFMSAQSDLKDDIIDRLNQGQEVDPEQVKEVVEEKRVSEPEASPSASDPDPVHQAPRPDPTPTSSSGSGGVYALDARIARTLKQSASDRLDSVLAGDFEDMDLWSQSCLVFGFGPELLGRKINTDVWTTIYESCIEDMYQDQADAAEEFAGNIEKFWEQEEEQS
jgi:hypothetical protein